MCLFKLPVMPLSTDGRQLSHFIAALRGCSHWNAEEKFSLSVVGDVTSFPLSPRSGWFQWGVLLLWDPALLCSFPLRWPHHRGTVAPPGVGYEQRNAEEQYGHPVHWWPDGQHSQGVVLLLMWTPLLCFDSNYGDNYCAIVIFSAQMSGFSSPFKEFNQAVFTLV